MIRRLVDFTHLLVVLGVGLMIWALRLDRREA